MPKFTREQVHEFLVAPDGYLAGDFRNTEDYVSLETALCMFLKKYGLMNEGE